ncbi:MAG: M48 family peptidase [wastewater metagenome]|nr:M48 family peptidase [Candidatus Loosdrechtia aerotolerans]
MTRHVVLIIIIAGLFSIHCSTVPITGRRQLSFISHSRLVEASKDSYYDMIESAELSDDPDKVRMVRNVGQKIALAAEQFMRGHDMGDELESYQWEFSLIQDDATANAFATPGGKIAVYTGILPVARDENGLAVILGHEVAHSLANHAGERMSQLLLVRLGGVALSVAFGSYPVLTRQLLMTAYGAGANVGIILPYSRGHESEADHIGLILMAHAGYDPRSAIQFWQRMSSMEDQGRPPEFLSTHPAPERRIQDIRDMVPEAMKYYRR